MVGFFRWHCSSEVFQASHDYKLPWNLLIHTRLDDPWPCFKVTDVSKYFTFTFTYFLTARVVGAPQMISQPFSSIFPCSPLPSGTWRNPGLSIPWCCLPTSSSALSSSPFHCALQDGFGQTWWAGDMSIPLQFASIYDGQEVFVWSNCLLDLVTDFLLGL